MTKRKPDRAPMIEQLEDRTLMSHTHSVSTTKLTFSTTAPLTSTIASPISQSVTAKITSNGLPLRTATVFFVADNAHVLGSAASGRSGYVTMNIPNVFAGKHLIQAFFTGSTRYVASQSRGVTITATVPTLTTTSDGLEFATIIPGTGTAAAANNNVTLTYAGYLTDGTLFDTSLRTGTDSPLPAQIGVTSLIQGFTEGITGMKLGETRLLVVPSALGYGTAGQGNIPANATLVFYIKMDSLS